MSKKVSIFVLILLLFTSINVFAGDVPESIMSGTQKALFIGKITGINTDTYSIATSTVMMGSIEETTVQIKKFDKYYGTNNKPKKGDFIVAILLDENTVDDSWIFKATSEDYKTLKLVSEQYGIVTRYEKYINEGKYFEAQKKIDADKKVSTAPTNVAVQNIELKKDTYTVKSSPPNYIFIAVFVILIACIVFFIATTLKKRHSD